MGRFQRFCDTFSQVFSLHSTLCAKPFEHVIDILVPQDRKRSRHLQGLQYRASAKRDREGSLFETSRQGLLGYLRPPGPAKKSTHH